MFKDRQKTWLRDVSGVIQMNVAIFAEQPDGRTNNTEIVDKPHVIAAT